MFTPIHRALGVEPGDLTPRLLEQAVQAKVAETADLDWKRGPYDPRDPKWMDEAAKDMAAMANSGGGWIVMGIREEGADNTAAELTPLAWNPMEEQRIRQAAYARIGPPVLGLEFHVVEVVGGDIVALRVPDSPDVPHFARKGEGAFTAPRRNGSHTVFMGEREIERAFRHRLHQAEDRERWLLALQAQASQGLDFQQGVHAVMAALPLEPIQTGSPMTEEDAHGFFNLPIPQWLIHPGAMGGLLRWNAWRVRKGLRQWLVRSEATESLTFRKAIHDDGVTLAAYRLGGISQREEAAAYFPVGQFNHCMSAHIESALLDFIATLRAHAKAQGTHGGFRIRVALQGRKDEPIYVRTTEGGTNFLLAIDHSEPIYAFQPVTSDLDPLGPVEVLLPALNDIARDIVNQGGVKHLKIMAEPGE